MHILPSDIGIIGGADGPTAIFVSGPAINWPILAASAVVAATVIIAIVVMIKKKNS